MVTDYFLFWFQKLCNQLNFRHKMAQYAARDSIDLHCQVMQLSRHCVLVSVDCEQFSWNPTRNRKSKKKKKKTVKVRGNMKSDCVHVARRSLLDLDSYSCHTHNRKRHCSQSIVSVSMRQMFGYWAAPQGRLKSGKIGINRWERSRNFE